MRAAVEELEPQFDVTIEVRGITPADLESLPADQRDYLADALPLAGVPPEAFVARPREGKPNRKIRSHADHDARGLALASAVAEKLARDPSLRARARAQIARRLPAASPRERLELEEWDRALRTTSPARLRSFLINPGERATRLRQTLPFLGTLTSAERESALATGVQGAARATRKLKPRPKAPGARKGR